MLRRRTLLTGTTAAMAAVTSARLGTRSGPLPAAAQQGMMPMGNLTDLSGADFEHRFIHQMVVHHAMAVVMTRPVARRAIHAELRTMAEAIVNDQAREISMMRGWLKEWQGMDMPDPVELMEGMGDSMMGGMAPPSGSATGGAMAGHEGHLPNATPSPTRQAAIAGSAGQMGSTAGGMMPDMMMSPMGMMMSMMGMMMMSMDLSALPPNRMEAVFMSQMVPHHEGALTMAALVHDRTTRPELHTLADAITSSQTAEIAQMNTWLLDWYGL